MSNAQVTHLPGVNITPEQARDVRARALAYAFSCWHAKQKDMSPQTAGDHLNNNAAKEVSRVEQSPDAPSSIDHQRFTKEKE